MSLQPRVPKAGVWVPAITYFNRQDDTIDLVSQEKYFKYLSTSGLTGLVVLGTNAETLLLTREERFTLLATARAAVGPSFPIIAGVSAHSTKQVLEHTEDAYRAGADYVLVLPCAYFGKATTTAVIESFFDEVASKSKLPVVIYNFPAVCNGVDIDSETMARIAKKNSNVVGVKLTCASVGKITRLAATFQPEEFVVFGGQADFLIGGLSVGSGGCISAFANVFPKTISRIYQLWTEGDKDEALRLHKIAALAESPCKSGISSTKYAVSQYSAVVAGIEGAEEKLWPRKPYGPPSEEMKAAVRAAMDEISLVEASL